MLQFNVYKLKNLLLLPILHLSVICCFSQANSNHAVFINFGMAGVNYPKVNLDNLPNTFPEIIELKKKLDSYPEFTRSFIEFPEYRFRNSKLSNKLETGFGAEIGLNSHLVLRASYSYGEEHLFFEGFKKENFYAKGINGLDTVITDYYGLAWHTRHHSFVAEILAYSPEIIVQISGAKIRFYTGFGLGQGLGNGFLYVRNVMDFYLGTRTSNGYELSQSPLNTLYDEKTYKSPGYYTISRFQVPIGTEICFSSRIGGNLELKVGHGTLKYKNTFKYSGTYFCIVNLVLKYKFNS